MDLTFGKEELAFQQEVRGWLKDNLTPELVGELKVGRNAYMPKEKLVDWQKRLAKKGWLCTGWPKEFGGPGFTTTQKYIFEMEMARRGRSRHLAVRPQDVRAGDHEVRLARAEGAAPAADAQLRPDLVPGLFRAWLGLRPRQLAHQGECARATSIS